jgi:hypothetical protein
VRNPKTNNRSARPTLEYRNSVLQYQNSIDRTYRFSWFLMAPRSLTMVVWESVACVVGVDDTVVASVFFLPKKLNMVKPVFRCCCWSKVKKNNTVFAVNDWKMCHHRLSFTAKHERMGDNGASARKRVSLVNVEKAGVPLLWREGFKATGLSGVQNAEQQRSQSRFQNRTTWKLLFVKVCDLLTLFPSCTTNAL